MKLVLDTNIFLAGFFTHGFILELLQTIIRSPSNFTIYSSPHLQEEFTEKVADYQKQHLITAYTADQALDFYKSNTKLVFPAEIIKVIKRDVDDNKVLECAVSAGANIIVTMDKDLLTLKTFRGIAIIHPKTFYYMLPNN